MGGLEVLETLQGQAARPKILVLSTLTSRNADMTHQALRLGADDFMLKPKDIPNVRGIERELVQKIRNLLRLPRVQKQTEIAHKDAETVVVIGPLQAGRLCLMSCYRAAGRPSCCRCHNTAHA